MSADDILDDGVFEDSLKSMEKVAQSITAVSQHDVIERFRPSADMESLQEQCLSFLNTAGSLDMCLCRASSRPMSTTCSCRSG